MASAVPEVVSLPLDDNADPRRPSVEEALRTLEAADEGVETALSPLDRLARLAGASGDISGVLDAQTLTEIGMRVVDDYQRDKDDRKEWEDTALEALDACSQEARDEAKTHPWPNASNMKYPLLTTAALQFNARMYPAVVKGDEAILVKVVGQDNGKPKIAPNGGPMPLMQPDPNGPPGAMALVPGPDGQPQVDWETPPGFKAKRARRVSEYLNNVLFYRMENWEDDTDALLMQLPAVGCVFRKIWMDADLGPQSATVSALRILVPKGARNLKTTPRLTEEIPDVYPYEILGRQRDGYYRELGDDALLMDEKDGKDGARLLLEQHCLWDLDEDGLPEPYIVTVDHETRMVLRIEPNFGPEDVKLNSKGQAASIKRRTFYVKYGMFPHPKGDFYDIGLGHLLKRLGAVIDTSINQLLDAGTAQTAGGGFIASGVRLQSRGARGVVRFSPGEYKTVDVSGDALRNALVERTLPNVSPVTFQVLELILGAAKEIAGAKDVITGEASNTGQVGTTLALIEQGLQVFNAAAKRIFRALKAEYELLFENIATFGGEEMAADYANVMDDPEADFAKDFSRGDYDIRPVSDPASITRMQKMAKAQFLIANLPAIAQSGGNAQEVMRRALEAIDAEDIDKIFPPPSPPSPEQQMQQQLALEGMAATVDKTKGEAAKAHAGALKETIEAGAKKFGLQKDAAMHGMELGALAGAAEGGELAAPQAGGGANGAA